jgi:hypothetical protein
MVMRMSRFFSALIGLFLFATACSVAGNGSGGNGTGSLKQGLRRPIALLFATSDGAVVLDPASESFRGFDRFGAHVWTDQEALRSGAEVVCLKRCPDVVFSGVLDPAGPDPMPWQIVAGQHKQLSISTAHTRRVLAARSPFDAVIVESELDGASWVRVIRPHADELRAPAAGTTMVWSENPSRTVALAFSRQPDVSDTTLLWFRREAQGWNLVDSHMPLDGAWGACVAGEGEVAVLVGPHPALIFDGQRRVPIQTDLGGAGECSLGRSGGIVLQRSMSRGERRTAIRGIDLSGRQTWARDYPEEVLVAADPSGRRFALAHGGKLELVDHQGRTRATYQGIDSAVFTVNGELVTATHDRQVRWTTADTARW